MYEYDKCIPDYFLEYPENKKHVKVLLYSL